MNAGRMLLEIICFTIFLGNAMVAHGMERFGIVTTRELADLLNARSRGETDFTLVNTLDLLISEHHSIPGSLRLPWSRIHELAGQLGEDREKLVITYCMGYR